MLSEESCGGIRGIQGHSYQYSSNIMKKIIGYNGSRTIHAWGHMTKIQNKTKKYIHQEVVA